MTFEGNIVHIVDLLITRTSERYKREMLTF